MAASGWQSTDLLAMLNRYTQRPTTDSITDTTKYRRLTEAQNRVVAMIAGIAPNSLYPKVAYGSIPTLTTTDNQVFTFGLDSNDYAVFPMGNAKIFTSLNQIPNTPWVEGVNYMNEGTQIRIPNNLTYTGTLYWYGMQQPSDIDATHHPSLLPEASRELIVLEAAKQFAEEGGRNPNLADRMQALFDRMWPRWCLVWKRQFSDGGALALYSGGNLASAGYSPNFINT